MSNSAATQDLAKKLKKFKVSYYVAYILLIIGAAPYFLTPTSARGQMDFATIALYMSLLIPGAIVMTYVKLALGKLDLTGDLSEAAKLAGAERLLKTFAVSAPPKLENAKLPHPKPAGRNKVEPETQAQAPSASLSSLSAGAKSGSRTKN